jgi:cytochrome c biogenesis protein CcmG/thiol:disulfide interchange protein DsbE
MPTLGRAVRWGLLLAAPFVIASCSTHKSAQTEVQTAAAPQPSVDTTLAPDFALPDLAGRTVHLKDFRGKVVVLDFWATWCAPCKLEIPHFAELMKRHGEKGLEIVGVAMDETGADVVKPFVQRNELRYHVLLGDDYTANRFGGVNALPTTFVIDRGGHIARKYIGYRSLESFEEDLAPLLDTDSAPDSTTASAKSG